MTELNKNSYIKILEENTDINKANIFNDSFTVDSLHNWGDYLTTTNTRIKINNQLQEISHSIRSINSPANIVYDESNNIGTINNLPLKWILARERLINNARALNNGWTVNWQRLDGDQDGRSYLYASNYNSETNRFLIDQTYAVWKQCENGLIFKNRELARQFIEQNEEDLQIYFSL